MTKIKVYERGLFTQGGASTADQIPLNPPVAGLPATVQGAIEEINSNVFAVAPQAIGGHRAVLIGAGGIQYADNSQSGRLYAIGITTGAANSGASVLIKTSGRIVESSWNWTVPGFVFLGQNGLLTQSAPAPPALFSQIMGIADTPTSLIINIHPPIVF